MNMALPLMGPAAAALDARLGGIDAKLGSLELGQQQLQQQMQQQMQQLQQQMQQMQQQLQLQLSALNPGAIAANIRAITAARAGNAHDRDHPYEVVQCDDGTMPPHWPAGFDRAALRSMTGAELDSLLGDYGHAVGPAAGAVGVRRNALARHIGTTAF